MIFSRSPGAAARRMCVAATLALPLRPAPVATAAVVAQPEQPHQPFFDIAQAAQPVALPSASVEVRAAVAQVDARLAVSECSAKAGLSEAEKNQIAEAPTPAAAVTAISEALGKIDSTTTLASSHSCN